MSTPAETPPLPAGEVRLLPDGTRAVCTGASYWRWKLVDVHNDPDGGWRTDRDAIGWERVGNVYELIRAATAVRDEPSSEDTPARPNWHVNQRVEIHNAITDKWSPATLTVVGSVTVPFEAVLDDGPACRFYNASPSHLRPLSEVPAGGEPA